MGITHWGITFFVIKNFLGAPEGPLQTFLKNTNFCIEEGTLAILVIAHCGTFKLHGGHKLQYAGTFFLSFSKLKSNLPSDSKLKGGSFEG